MFKEFAKKFKKWSLTLQIIPIVLAIILLKIGVHYLGWEIIKTNPFLPSLVSAAVFLLGFLIAGVLSDYKESEKLPGEIAVSLENIADELTMIYKTKQAESAKEFIIYVKDFSHSLNDWFYKRIKTEEIYSKLRGFNDYFIELEKISPGSISRMKAEQGNIRKTITRINTIKETNFISSGYAIAEGISALVILAMILTKLEPFWEALCFVIPVTYVLVYMIALIKDLDNPFEYSSRGERGDEVSLEVIHEEISRLDEKVKEMEKKVIKKKLP